MSSVAKPCAYCGEVRKLCLSHAIPDAFFRPILQRNHGSAIVLPGGNEPIHRSGDTGKFELLCQDCESLFNYRFDRPLIQAFRQLERRIVREGFSARIPCDHDQLAQSIASIFWRASASPHRHYADATVTPGDQKRLLEVAFAPKEMALRLASVSIQRLYDPTPLEQGGFNQSALSELLTMARAYSRQLERTGQRRHFLLSAVMLGFLVQICIPRLPYVNRSAPQFLKNGAKILHTPPFDMFRYPPLKQALVNAYGKQMSGQSTLDRT